MTQHEKILKRIMDGDSDANIPFSELCTCLKRLGFTEHIRGDHHIFTKADVIEILNIQPRNALAKPYHIKQVRNLIRKYRLEHSDRQGEK